MENQNPVYVFATWKVKKGQIETVFNLLKSVRDESIKENGNLFYKIHQSNLDSNILVLSEGYEDEAAVEKHRNSSYFQDLVVGKIVLLLESRDVIVTSAIV